MTDLDIERAGVLQEVLRFVVQPHTAEEVADEFGWHPQTARMKLWELRNMGNVRELPRKRGRMKLWQATSLAGKMSENGYVIVTSRTTRPLSSYAVNSMGGRRALSDIVAGALCYVWRRAYYKQQDQDNVLNVAKQGSLDPLLDVRKGLEKIYLHYQTELEALGKMLTEMPELWQDGNPLILEFFGTVNREQIEEMVGDFEPWMRRWLEGGS